MEPSRYVVVLGSSYCGSTLFARLATLIPNAQSVGELHWVVDDRYPWDCRRCFTARVECPVDWNGLRGGQESSLYVRALDHFNVQTLITTDKIPRIVQRFVDPAQVDALVMWKRPEAMIASYRRHKEPEDSFLYHYPKLLDWAEAHCRSVASLRYEDLASNPDQAMATVCDKYGLSRIPHPIDYSSIDSHVVGGNLVAHTIDTIYLDERWKEELTFEEQDRIVNDEPTRDLVSRLLRMAL